MIAYCQSGITHACATESDFCNALENYGISYTDSVVADCEIHIAL